MKGCNAAPHGPLGRLRDTVAGQLPIPSAPSRPLDDQPVARAHEIDPALAPVPVEQDRAPVRQRRLHGLAPHANDRTLGCDEAEPVVPRPRAPRQYAHVLAVDPPARRRRELHHVHWARPRHRPVRDHQRDQGLVAEVGRKRVASCGHHVAGKAPLHATGAQDGFCDGVSDDDGGNTVPMHVECHRLKTFGRPHRREGGDVHRIAKFRRVRVSRGDGSLRPRRSMTHPHLVRSLEGSVYLRDRTE